MDDSAKTDAVIAKHAGRHSLDELRLDREFTATSKNMDARQREINEDPRRTPEQKMKAQMLYLRSHLARSSR